nr:MAG TPA: hypothetical protein [Caudoviricetes sp.]
MPLCIKNFRRVDMHDGLTTKSLDFTRGNVVFSHLTFEKC